MPFYGAGRGRFLTWVSDLGVSGPGAPPKGLGKLLCFVEGGEMFLLIRWELFRTWRSHPRRVRTLCPAMPSWDRSSMGRKSSGPAVP